MAPDFSGQSEVEVQAMARELFDGVITKRIYQEAASCVRAHFERGHVVCIVSGATKFLIEPLARLLGIEHMVYTRLETRQGIFTGRVLEPVCFEDGKVYWLKQFIEDEKIDLAGSWFYTDSVTDRPLLDLVGHPMVANPAPVLYRLVLGRCWPVRFFDMANDGEGVTPEGLEADGARQATRPGVN